MQIKCTTEITPVILANWGIKKHKIRFWASDKSGDDSNQESPIIAIVVSFLPRFCLISFLSQFCLIFPDTITLDPSSTPLTISQPHPNIPPQQVSPLSRTHLPLVKHRHRPCRRHRHRCPMRVNLQPDPVLLPMPSTR